MSTITGAHITCEQCVVDIRVVERCCCEGKETFLAVVMVCHVMLAFAGICTPLKLQLLLTKTIDRLSSVPLISLLSML